MRRMRVSTYEFWWGRKHTDHSERLMNTANLTTILVTFVGNVLTFNLKILIRYFIPTVVLVRYR